MKKARTLWIKKQILLKEDLPFLRNSRACKTLRFMIDSEQIEEFIREKGLLKKVGK